MKACRDARKWIDLSFAGALPLADELRLEVHTRECQACRERWRENQLLLDALEAQPVPPEERLDLERSLAAIHARLDEAPRALRISATPAPVTLRTPSRVRPWRAAAAVLLLLGGGLLLRRALPPSASPVPAGEHRDTPGEALVADAPEEALDAAPAAPAIRPGVRIVPYPDWEATDFDPGKLDSVRGLVREKLAAIASDLGAPAADLDGDRSEQLARRLELDCDALTRLGWPLTQVAVSLVDDADAELGSAALRYLGRRGTRVQLRAIEAALARPDRAPAALAALVELAAFDARLAGDCERALARALWDPALSERVADVVRPWHADQPERLVQWVRRALAAAPHARGGAATPPEEAVANLVPDLLADAGLVGARELLGLFGHPLLRVDRVLDALVASPEGRQLVLDATAQRGSRTDRDRERALLAAVDRLHPDESYAWLVDRAWFGQDRDAAVHALAGYPGVQAVVDLLDLSQSTRASDDAVLAALRRAIEIDPERMVRLAELHGEFDDPRACERYLEWLVLTGKRAAVPAILALVRHGDLGPRERERAVLAAGELGDPRDLAELTRLFDEARPGERGLAAAALLGIHRLGGEPEVRAALPDVDDAEVARLLGLLQNGDRARSTAATLFQLERELEPLLRAREPYDLR